eukprot:GEMP01021637.1.p1 GENE.GEMP01021637.1~~GEMP01021637.1.p1  ORF type:complete len:293 (+),score=58.11 GEMP01021637.1:192-1070(+)
MSAKAKAFGKGLAFVGVANAALFYGGVKAYKHCWPGREDDGVISFKDLGKPTEQQRLEIFRDTAKIWDKGIGEKEDRGGISKWRKTLLSHHRVKGDVLELGIGTGRNIPFIKEFDLKSFHGVDAVDEMLEQAKPKVAEMKCPAMLVKADMHNLPYPDGSFDTIILTFCLCSSEDPKKLLKEAQRVLRPNGRVLLLEHGPSPYFLVQYFNSHFRTFPDPKHPWANGCYDDRDPLQLIKEANMPVFYSELKLWGHWYMISCGSSITSEVASAPDVKSEHIFWQGAGNLVVPQDA